MKYHIANDPDQFAAELSVIREHGFRPIAVSQFLTFTAFAFETEDEADDAFALLEDQLQMVNGWWYSKEGILSAAKDYENTYNSKVLIHWL